MNLRALSLAIAAAIFALDRITKVWIEGTVSLWDSYHVIPGFFNIVHTKNKGAAFGMFAESDSPFRTTLLIAVSLSVLLFILYVLLRPGKAGFSATRLTTIGLALVMGGALGNIYDRVLSRRSNRLPGVLFGNMAICRIQHRRQRDLDRRRAPDPGHVEDAQARPMLPKLIDTGGFFLPTYGVLVAIAFLVAIWLTGKLASKAGLQPDKVTNLAIYCALAGMAGAKLLMFVFDWRTYLLHPSEIFTLSTLQAAGVYQGGLLLAILVAFFYMRHNGFPAY